MLVRRLMLSLLLLCGSPALADAPPAPPAAFRVVAAPPALRASIELGSGPGQEQWEAFFDQVSVRNVTGAALYPVLPRAGRGNGQAVIVVPGGGYRFVSIESEGFRVAEALAARGYAAFVLKYRTVQTPREIPAYLADMARLFGGLGKGTLADCPEAVDDLATAIRHVRANAGQWGVDPAEVGVIGFSAGSGRAARRREAKREAAESGNVSLIFPPTTKTVQPAPRPPLFLAIAVDDPLFRQGGLGLVQHWLAESPKVEFHLYAGGSHGFGMRANGNTSDLWIDQYLAWLDRK